MKMKLFLNLFFVLVSAGVAINATPPTNIDKALSAEIKKQFSKADYSVVPIAVPEKYKVAGQFYLLNSTSNPQIKYAYFGRVVTDRSGNRGGSEGADFLDYVAFYSPTFSVQKVKVVRFSSEHGAGVCSAGWLKQFVGLAPGKMLTVGKNVNAISGATATVNLFTFDIQSKTYILKEIEGGRK